MTHKEKIYKLASRLEDVLNEAYRLTGDEQKIKRFLKDRNFAVMCENTNLRRMACEISLTYTAIWRNVEVEFIDYEFKVKPYTNYL